MSLACVEKYCSKAALLEANSNANKRVFGELRETKKAATRVLCDALATMPEEGAVCLVAENLYRLRTVRKTGTKPLSSQVCGPLLDLWVDSTQDAACPIEAVVSEAIESGAEDLVGALARGIASRVVERQPTREHLQIIPFKGRKGETELSPVPKELEQLVRTFVSCEDTIRRLREETKEISKKLAQDKCEAEESVYGALCGMPEGKICRVMAQVPSSGTPDGALQPQAYYVRVMESVRRSPSRVGQKRFYTLLRDTLEKRFLECSSTREFESLIVKRNVGEDIAADLRSLLQVEEDTKTVVKKIVKLDKVRGLL